MLKKKRIICGILLIFIAVLLVMSGLIISKAQKTRRYQKQLDLGNKFLAELNYEDAELCYIEAIEIEQKNVEPYLRLSEIYVNQQRFDYAKEILEKAAAAIESDEPEKEGQIAEWKTYVEEAEKVSQEEVPNEEEKVDANEQVDLYGEYRKLIEEYEQKYGVAKYGQQGPYNGSYLTGLCFLKLVDFDKNGEEELLLIYEEQDTEDSAGSGVYVVEVWGYQNGKIKKLGTPGLYVLDIVEAVVLTEYKELIYLQTGMAGGIAESYYYGLDEDEFKIMIKVLTEADGESSDLKYSIDGNTISLEEREKQEQLWLENSETYVLYGGMENFGDAEAIFELIETTKKKL